jgi:hypothetical protein
VTDVIEREEVIAVFWALADILAGVNEIKDLLLEDDGEETED